MGRYDKIRVWNGSSWTQPNQIRVWNGSSWQDYGANDSANTNSIYVWNGSSWIRKTLNRTVNYGDKQWACSADGGCGTFNVGSSANVNQNKFNFYFYCTRDYANDKNVATFGNTTQGWRLTWMADGRIRWSIFWGGSGGSSYSSNYIGVGTFAVVNAYSNSTGTGNGTLNFGGTTTSITRSWRHQYNGLSLIVGSWGMLYRGHMRSYGINGGGDYGDYYSYVNDYAVKTGAQTASNMSLNSACTVTQDTSISWT